MPYLGKPPPLTASVLEDADQDTKIQVEESADEDTIRFDIAGAEVATLTDSSLVLKGTTPTLTIGDAGAEDAKIVFDGNAQDYHIGLDDAGDYADYLLIGLGSALGTTPYMAIGPTGTVTAPFQPGFSAKAATAQLNIAVGSAVDIVLGTELWDTNADFASNTFTAPITGKYLFTWLINVYYPDAAANAYTIYLTTSNRTYDSHMDPDFGQDQVYWYFSGSMVADMDTSDTAKMQIIQTAGSSQTDIFEDTRFSGILIG
jgi:hypothetical protein